MTTEPENPENGAPSPADDGNARPELAPFVFPGAAETPPPARSGTLALVGRIAGYVGIAVVVLSIAMIASVVYAYGIVGILILIGITAVAGAIGFALTLIPLGPAGGRKPFHLLAAAVVAFIALWGTHGAVYGDALAKRETFGAVAGAKDAAEARARLQAIAADNPYAAFLLYVTQRAAVTRAAVKTLLDQSKAGEIDWTLSVDPTDKDALQSLRSRLLDIDVLLSAVPDQVKALYAREAEEIRATAEKAGLAQDFRISLETGMAQRHKDYTAFFIALAATMRHAAVLLGDITQALADGKAKRGDDGKFVYGDDKTKAAVEPLLAELDKTRKAIAKLAEIAKALDQKYEGVGR